MLTTLLTPPWFYLCCLLVVLAILGVWTWKHTTEYKRELAAQYAPSTYVCDECHRNVEHVTRTWHPDGYELLLCRGCASQLAGQRTIPQQQPTQAPRSYGHGQVRRVRQLQRR